MANTALPSLGTNERTLHLKRWHNAKNERELLQEQFYLTY